MPTTIIYALVLAAIVLSILISWKTRVNLGLIGLFFAYIIGCLVMRMKVSEVVALTPLRIIFQLVAITLFFAFPNQNGTLEMIANHALYRFRNKAWAIPFILFFTSLLLCLMGSPPPVSGTIVAVLGFRIAKRANIHPLLVSAAAVFGGAGANVPYAMSGAIYQGTVAANGYPETAELYTWKFFICSLTVFCIVLTAYYFVLKGHKTKPVAMEKPAPATAKQKANIIIIVAVVGLVVVPNILGLFISSPAISFMKSYFDIQMLSIVGALLCIFLKLGEEKKIIASVPWNTIIMIGGISILLGIAHQAGVSDWLGSLVTQSVPQGFIGPMLSMFGGLLSFFAGGITVVFPMLATMVPSLVASSGLAPSFLFVSMASGANITTISPFSAGGAIVLAACHDESDHKKLFSGQLITAFVGLAVSMLLSFLGYFNIIAY